MTHCPPWPVQQCVIALPDAPSDGVMYGRVNGTWAPVLSANGGQVGSLVVENDLTAQFLTVTEDCQLNNLVVTDNAEMASNVVVNGTAAVNGGNFYVDQGGVVIHNVGTAVDAHDTSASNNFCVNVSSDLSGLLIGFFYGGGDNPLVPVATQPGSITATTDGTTVMYNTSSDARLKTHEHAIDPVAIGAIIDAIEPKAYRWLHGRKDSAESFGLMAQELEPLFPGAVTKGKGVPGAKDFVPWQIDYSKLVPLLIAEVRELRRRVSELEPSKLSKAKAEHEDKHKRRS